MTKYAHVYAAVVAVSVLGTVPFAHGLSLNPECTSLLNCSQLRFISHGEWREGANDQFGSEKVCGESNIPSTLSVDGCHNDFDFKTALAVCVSAGTCMDSTCKPLLVLAKQKKTECFLCKLR